MPGGAMGVRPVEIEGAIELGPRQYFGIDTGSA
jgi:hypothetical protein